MIRELKRYLVRCDAGPCRAVVLVDESPLMPEPVLPPGWAPSGVPVAELAEACRVLCPEHREASRG